MPAAASTVPAAKQKIIDLLTARSGLAGVTISWGGPTKREEMAYEHIFFAKTTHREDWSAIGNRRKVETYTLDLRVIVHQDGDDEHATELRWWQLHTEIASALRDSPQLSAVLNRQCELAGVKDQVITPSDPQGWIAVGDLLIDCEATSLTT